MSGVLRGRFRWIFEVVLDLAPWFGGLVWGNASYMDVASTVHGDI